MKVSILDLAPLREDGNYKKAINDMLDMAEDADKMGYARFWVAEHHNSGNFASSATVLLMDEALKRTKNIKIGSGGIMLPNHSPYIVAEQLGTLETLYPGRVELGLGRAPGTDQETSKAIRRTTDTVKAFPDEVKEILGYFDGSSEVDALPAKGLNVPVIILGSSVHSAHLAAELGLPYSFASHFAPANLEKAIREYRENFKPSKYLQKPYVIIGVNVFAADSEKEAKKLRTTQIQAFLDIVTNKHRPLQPPVDDEQEIWDKYINENIHLLKSPHFGPVKIDPKMVLANVKTVVDHMDEVTLVGTKEEIQEQVKQLQAKVDFDEMVAVSFIYDTKAMHKSFRIFKDAIENI